MIKLSRMADYAFVCLQHLMALSGARINAQCLSVASGLPEPAVAKLLRTMAKAGILNSAKGPTGGYWLAHAVHKISVAQVIKAIDGPIALTACVPGSADRCDYQNLCPVRGGWNVINQAVFVALDSVTLADFYGAGSAGDIASMWPIISQDSQINKDKAHG